MLETRLVDFTSASYLGLRHRSGDLRPWSRLTTSRPALLGLPSLAREVAAGLARLVGAEAAVLAPSTLHAMWDVTTSFPPDAYDVVLDASAYETTRAGLAAIRRPVGVVPHYDAAAVEAECRQSSLRGRRPLVVMDGTCPGCGRVAPITEVADLVRRAGGVAVFDDTQAVGILGEPAATPLRWGRGGGGTARRLGVLPRNSTGLLIVASLGKGFAVPVTVIAGDAAAVARIEQHGASPMYSSPPSAAALAAVAFVLEHNGEIGRSRLRAERNVERLRAGLTDACIPVGPGTLPFQLVPVDKYATDRIRRAMLRRRVEVPVIRRRCRPGVALAVCVRADHPLEHLDCLVETMVAVGLGRCRRTGVRSCSS